MPHQKHFLKITLLFLKTQKERIKIRVFLVIKTVRTIKKCMIVIDRNYLLILSKK